MKTKNGEIEKKRKRKGENYSNEGMINNEKIDFSSDNSRSGERKMVNGRIYNGWVVG